MRYIHTIKYYSALKRNEILIPVTTWTKLKNVMLRDVSQTQKDNYYMIPLNEICKIIKFRDRK